MWFGFVFCFFLQMKVDVCSFLFFFSFFMLAASLEKGHSDLC